MFSFPQKPALAIKKENVFYFCKANSLECMEERIIIKCMEERKKRL